jgi:signal transduction histidine kinase
MAIAVRHGGARAIRVEVDTDDDGVELSVHDDGTGFPPGFEVRGNSRHTGLAGIRERVTAVGGRLEVGDTETGGGRVTVRVPWTHLNGAAG